MATLGWRLRIRNAADTADDIVVTSLAGGVNPYIAEEGIPSGEGQTLNPTTGEVTTGSYTVGVIDAVDTIAVEELVASNGLESSRAAMEADGWVFDDTLDDGEWGFGATDQVYAGAGSLKAVMTGTGGLAGSGVLRATKVFGPADGIQPLTFYTVKVRVRMSFRATYDVHTKLWVFGLVTTGTEAAVTTDGVWQELVVQASSTVDGELTVRLERTHAFTTTTQDIWFDALSISRYLTGEDRIITSRLADATGKPALMSRRAYLEETEDEGDTFEVLIAGYLTELELTTALRFTFTVGESNRIEQTTKVFEVPEPGFDRVSCIVGGPIIGDFGPFIDGGRPRFSVKQVTSEYVVLQWTGGYIYSPLLEREPPLLDRNLEFINSLGQPYLGEWQSYGLPFPDLRVRLFKIDTTPGVTENYPTSPIAITQDFVPLAVLATKGTVLPGSSQGYGLFGVDSVIALRWPDDPAYPTQPEVGARFKAVIFPRAISEHNPLHWKGHPVDLVTGLLTLRGYAWDATSADDVKAELGDIELELRITGPMSLADALKQLAYGPFGFTARTNSAGVFEFFTVRHRSASVPVDTITLADLRDPTPPVWRVAEGTAVNKVTYKLRAFNPVGTVRQSGAPIDYLSAATVPIEAIPNTSDFDVFGDRGITYDLPGRLLNTDPDDFVAGQAGEIFEEQGRGAIQMPLACLRGSTDALIGQEVVVDLPHLPTANPTQSPVSQRGTTPRIGLVLRRTMTRGDPDFLLQDRGIALAAPLLPEFTVTASVTDPRKLATVEITNGPALEAEGVNVRVEWAVSAGTPSASRLLKVLDPATDPLTFDLPAVDAGARVWVRMRTEEAGKRPGAWTAFDDADLDDLDVPTSFAGTVAGASVDLSWAVGANAADIPLEVLFRELGETTWEPAGTLPPGSTQYRLFFPDPEQDYEVGVRHREAAPFAGISPTATLELTSEPVEVLSAPINPAAFSDGRGTFGLEVTGTVFPSGTAFWVAVETAIGSGVAGTYAAAGSIPTVSDGRTQFTNPVVVANDGKLRFLKARHERNGALSDFCTEVPINPWLVVEPTPTEPEPDPSTGIVDTTPIIPLFKGGTVPIGLREVGAARAVLLGGRGTETKHPLDGMTAARVVAEIAQSTMPIGAYLAVEFEATEAPGVWASLDGADGPTLPVDPDSLDLLDVNEDEDAWVAAGDWFAIREEALNDVRLRGVIAEGDGGSGTLIISGLELEVRALAVDGQPDQVDSPPPDDPGSCDTPGDLDDLDYANQAAAESAGWVFT